MKGRVRLCPYYFVSGEGDAARPQLGGVLATIDPADKKIIHGMTDAILAPCAKQAGVAPILTMAENSARDLGADTCSTLPHLLLCQTAA